MPYRELSHRFLSRRMRMHDDLSENGRARLILVELREQTLHSQTGFYNYPQTIRAPYFTACERVRATRSLPITPSGKLA